MSVSRQAIALLALIGASLVALAPTVAGSGAARPLPAGSAAASLSRPHALKVFINGKRYATSPLNGSDNYVNIATGRLRFVARWLTDARGSGYRVVISTTEPAVRTYARCSTGTSCRVEKRVRILAGQEMSWQIKIVRTRNNRLAAGVKVCLSGRI